MILSLAIDIFVIVLLMVTIAYSFILNKQLNILRSNEKKLQDVLSSFNITTEKASKSIGELKDVSDKSKQQLQDVVDNANTLRDELMFLIDRGSNLADKMVEEIRETRKKAAPPPSPVKEKKTKKKKSKVKVETNNIETLESEVEKELYKVLNPAS